MSGSNIRPETVLKQNIAARYFNYSLKKEETKSWVSKRRFFIDHAALEAASWNLSYVVLLSFEHHFVIIDNRSNTNL